MKYSGIEWIGNIPDNWSLNKIGQLFNLRNEKVSDTVYAPLSVTKGGVVPQMDSVAKSDANDDRKLVLTGDFVINSRSDRKQSCGVSPSDGSVSLINTVLYPKNNRTIYKQYLNYLLKNHGFAEEFYRWGHGIVADLWTTRWQEMKNIIIPTPSFETQERLNSFISEKERELLLLINNENKQIDSLVSFKRALINKCVTKGINKNVNLVDSGCKWIGMIPEHWEVKKAKFVSTSLEKGSGITKEDVMADGDTACVRYGEIYSKYDNFFEACLIRTNLDRVLSPSYFESGDILFAGTGELVEEIGKNVLYKGSERCLAGGDIIIMKHNQHPGYLNYAMNSISSQLQKSYDKAKLKVVHISATDIGNIYICLPSLEEQKQISDYLDKKCVAINKLIEIKKDKIEKLEEYKKSLIYEYVTGKKEVC